MEIDHATPAITNSENRNLFRAIEADNSDEVLSLLESGAVINDHNFEGNPLIEAIRLDRVSIVELLLKHGANSNLIIFVGGFLSCDTPFPIHVAAYYGNLNIIKLLVEYGANINSKSASNEYPIDRAAIAGHAQVIDYFLENGANVNIVNPKMDGFNWISYSCEAIEHFLGRGLNINDADDEGRTALHVCASKNWSKKMEFLIQNGALIDMKDGDNQTPISEVIRSESYSVALIGYSVDDYNDFKSIYVATQMIIKYALLQNHKQQVDMCFHFPSHAHYFRQFWDDCKAEINKMQCCKIKNSDLTVYKFLQDIFDPTKLVQHLNNENICKKIKTIEEYIEHLPIYSSVINVVKNKIEKGGKRKLVLDEALLVMDNVIPKLPFEIQWEIFSFLCISDLKNFSIAFKNC